MVRPESEAESGISGHLISRLNPSQRAGRFRLRGGAEFCFRFALRVMRKTAGPNGVRAKAPSPTKATSVWRIRLWLAGEGERRGRRPSIALRNPDTPRGLSLCPLRPRSLAPGPAVRKKR